MVRVRRERKSCAVKIKVYAELHNGAIRGNTYERVINVDEDDDFEGVAEEEVMTNMVGWGFEVIE